MTQRLCVASVPAGHPYIARALAHPDLVVLPDPAPIGAAPGQWWPPVILTPGWLTEHADRVDVLHLHFGTESFEPRQLIAVVDEAHARGIPVVYTVHDLVHPQLADQGAYREQLDVLVPRVDAVLTLSHGAAQVIRDRWDREAVVVKHPRLLPGGMSAPAGVEREEAVIGVFLKDLRPNVDGPSSVAGVIAAVNGLRRRGIAVSGEVRMHRDVRTDSDRDRVRDQIRDTPNVLLIEHDRLDDVALAEALAHLDACVLPYRSGTHSGWLELCWDLGVPVAAPSVGFFGEQHDDPTIGSFALGSSGAGSPSSPAEGDLEDCLLGILRAGSRAGSAERLAVSEARLASREVADRESADVHAALYRSLDSRTAVR